MVQQLKSNLQFLFKAMAARERELRLGQTAASLSFISILALVPLLTVVLATLASFPIFSKILEAVQLVIVQNLLPDGFAMVIYRYLNQFVAKARTLSVVGIGFLLLTATMMMLTLDRTLNLIWRVRRPRPLMHRISIYWLALLLGPILVGAGASLAMLVAQTEKVQVSFFGIEWSDVLNVLLVCAAFTLCYRWIPNARVAWRDALVGGVVGAVVTEIGRALFLGTFAALPTYRQVYGPLAAIPALLIWTYLSWWVFLAGALLASILPEWRAAGASISAMKDKGGEAP